MPPAKKKVTKTKHAASSSAPKKKAVKKTVKKSGKYGASDITVLEGLEAVRRRPGMYIGTTGSDGLYHLIWEVFDNSRDEAMGGYADEIEIVLLPNDTVRVADNGRGIPTDIHPKTKVSALETIMTTLHAGGKFGDSGYSVSGGLHGVGVSVVNALSKEVIATVHRDGGIFHQEYHLGKQTGKVKKIGSTDEHGTVILFRPDESIFTTTKFDGTAFSPERVKDHLRNQSYLVKSMHVRIVDAPPPPPAPLRSAHLTRARCLFTNMSPKHRLIPFSMTADSPHLCAIITTDKIPFTSASFMLKNSRAMSAWRWHCSMWTTSHPACSRSETPYPTPRAARM